MKQQALQKKSESIKYNQSSGVSNANNELPATLKYKLYTDAVQDPAYTIKTLDQAYQLNFDKNPLSVREDFCGTFLVGCEWVKSSPDRIAHGVDLDSETLRFAKKNIGKLINSDKQRAILSQQDVRVATIPRVDIISAENFSFYIFKRRQDLLSYFKAAYASLNKEGVLVLDMIGGAGFTKTPCDSRRTIKEEETGLPCPVTYRWRQRDYNALNNNAKYFIDFKIKDRWYNEVFSYDWRIWSLPEVLDIMNDAGFQSVKVYWDQGTSDAPKLIEATDISNEWETWSVIVSGIKNN